MGNPIECRHGTHVAGIIGAVGNNERGISGVTQNVTLVPLQTAATLSDGGLHDSDDVEDAIQDAINRWENIDTRISVLNYSVGGFGTSVGLLEQVENYPGLFVWAAGNETANVDERVSISEFKLSNIISVGALNSSGERWYKSNYGMNVDIYAPGEGIYSTVTNSQYESWNGTSMAAPHVSGVAALALSLNSKLTGAELKELILNNADTGTITTPDGTTQTVKKLNAYKVVSSMDLYETEEVDDGCIITQVNYDGSAELVVPEEIDGMTVVGIGDYAFSDCEYVTSVVLPYTVTKLGKYAFRNCYALQGVEFKTDWVMSIDGDFESVFYGCNSLDQILISDGLLFGLYQEAFEWEAGLRLLHVHGYTVDLSDWLILTNADTSDLEVLNLVNFYGMGVDYFTPTLTENGFLDFGQIEDLMTNDYFHYLIYLTEYIPYEREMLMQMVAAGIGDFALVNGGYVDMRGEATVIRDTYSLGFNIATEYLVENEDSVLEFEEDLGYFPVFAPIHYKNDTLFLKGMSDVFGYPIEVFSTPDEFVSVKQQTEELGIYFEDWVFVEFEKMDEESEYGLNFLEYFAEENINFYDFYYFSRDLEWLDQIGISTLNSYVYQIADKCSLLEGIVPALIQGETEDFANWYFNPVERWIEILSEEGYDETTFEVWHEKWLEYWAQKGYTVNETQWTEYWMLRWTVSGRIPFYGGVDDWDSYYELARKLEVEQVLI